MRGLSIIFVCLCASLGFGAEGKMALGSLHTYTPDGAVWCFVGPSKEGEGLYRKVQKGQERLLASRLSQIPHAGEVICFGTREEFLEGLKASEPFMVSLDNSEYALLENKIVSLRFNAFTPLRPENAFTPLRPETSFLKRHLGPKVLIVCFVGLTIGFYLLRLTYAWRNGETAAVADLLNFRTCLQDIVGHAPSGGLSPEEVGRCDRKGLFIPLQQASQQGKRETEPK